MGLQSLQPDMFSGPPVSQLLLVLGQPLVTRLQPVELGAVKLPYL